MKKILTLALFIVCQLSHGQYEEGKIYTDTTYFDSTTFDEYAEGIISTIYTFRYTNKRDTTWNECGEFSLSDGKIKEGKYTSYWSSSQVPGTECYYVKGKREGLIINYLPNGGDPFIEEKYSVKNEIKEGEYTSYHAKDILATKGQYKKGVKVGVWNYYDEDGKLMRTENKSEFRKTTNGVVRDTIIEGNSVEYLSYRYTTKLTYDNIDFEEMYFKDTLYYIEQLSYEYYNEGKLISRKIVDEDKKVRLVEWTNNISFYVPLNDKDSLTGKYALRTYFHPNGKIDFIGREEIIHPTEKKPAYANRFGIFEFWKNFCDEDIIRTGTFIYYDTNGVEIERKFFDYGIDTSTAEYHEYKAYLIYMNDSIKGIQELEKVMNKFPKEGFTIYSYAKALEEAGKNKEALMYYKKCLALDRKNIRYKRKVKEIKAKL
jgi:antitoxin component YwqK of YwqJK toxin-antitoxin module